MAPAGTRLLVFAGKGGVGKTTCAATAALALTAAAPGRRVLLLSTDPAHSLADVLAIPLDDAERPVRGASAGLRVRELDAERALGERRARYRAAVQELFAAVGAGLDTPFDRIVVEDLIDLVPPGVDELLAVLSVTEALRSGEGAAAGYDAVVLDTAPTGHTLRLLALPGAALEWLRAVLAILLKYREVVRPGRLAEDLVALSRELRALERLLRDRHRSRAVVVTRAGELPRRETRRLLQHLGVLGIATPAVILNAVPGAGRPLCRPCARGVAEARREIERLRTTCARRPRDPCRVIVAPETSPPPRGVSALDRWGRTWHIRE